MSAGNILLTMPQSVLILSINFVLQFGINVILQILEL